MYVLYIYVQISKCTIWHIWHLQKQNIEVKQMKQTLMDELTKLRSSVSLDMSLERARAKEDVSYIDWSHKGVGLIRGCSHIRTYCIRVTVALYLFRCLGTKPRASVSEKTGLIRGLVL